MINVETGFKFIAEQIKNFEATGDHTFLFGFEESYGYLIKPFVRDKDAIQSMVLLAEVAAYYKRQGKTLYDGIQALYAKYGYFAEKTTAIEFDGLDGADKMNRLMTHFREANPESFAGYKVMSVMDLQAQTITYLEDGHSVDVDLPESNVLKYQLENETWIAIRPSGTEPKVKFYVGTSAPTAQAAQDKLTAFENDLHTFIEDAQ